MGDSEWGCSSWGLTEKGLGHSTSHNRAISDKTPALENYGFRFRRYIFGVVVDVVQVVEVVAIVAVVVVVVVVGFGCGSSRFMVRSVVFGVFGH